MRVYVKRVDVRRFLARKNFTITEMAEMLDFDYIHLMGILSGKISVSPKIRRKLQEFLGVEFDDIFWIKEDKKDKEMTEPQKMPESKEGRGKSVA
ncbi:MAG: hypothetical protein A2X93_07935 [Deltaproteobacteria bacterium GWC2_56_8]|nr:MAG: hypothetical protein A2X93_07935 [Deltaproteobacteria bacterium GWC2_56_8]